MTKEEYLALRHVPTTKWTYDQCLEVDALIKVMATEQFAKTIKAMQLPETLQEYLILMVTHHFGSAATDTLLLEMKCYPDWLLPAK